jgi:hypothetical protein
MSSLANYRANSCAARNINLSGLNPQAQKNILKFIAGALATTN